MKRLKIAEQIIIVLFIAVVLPFAASGIIIANISQHSIRDELVNSVSLMAESLGNAVKNYVNYSQNELKQIASGFKYIEDAQDRIKYFDEIEKRTKLYKSLDISENYENQKEIEYSENKVTIYAPIDNYYSLKADIDINISKLLFGEENTKNRHIYVFSSKTHELIATNAPKSTADEVLNSLSVSDEVQKTIFGDIKNTPKAYYKITNPDWFIVVDTTSKVTKNTIAKLKTC